MSRYSETPAVILQEWNAILANGCCCEMPDCPNPALDCESIDGTAYLAFRVFDAGTYYRTYRIDWSEGGYSLFTSTYDHQVDLGGQIIVDFDYNDTTVEPAFGTGTDTYSDPIDLATARDNGYDAMLAGLDWATMDKGNDCHSRRIDITPLGSPFRLLEAKFHRFRWVIPDTFQGTWFKITWDVIEEPLGWDEDPPTATRSYHAENQTWEWTGPGDPEDPESWKSPWIEIPVPAVSGSRRVVNIRFECYRSARYGHLPQITGDAVTLPDP